MIISWITNSKMKKLLENIAALSDEEELQINLQQLKELLFPPFKQVKDCIIMSKKPIDVLELAYDNSIKLNMDKTGYEACCSETRINTYFKGGISTEAGTKIALIVLEIWALRLKELQPDSRFCLIIFSDESCVEIRFHKIHEGENMWLDEEIENYKDGAAGYALI